MLAECAAQADVVVIPTPISLHAAMHRSAIKAGLAVYLEKPPTLDPAELDEMIVVEKRARIPTVVGFNFIVEPERLALKARLLAGEFGVLREVRTLARWPRRAGYFRRNAWAGRLLTDAGRPLLDSCFGNAMAHYVHNTLHWAGGRAQLDWGEPVEVRAQLARAHVIDGADTFLVAARTADGVALRLAFTHAAAGHSVQRETIVCEDATLVYVVGSHCEITFNDGRTERHALPPFDPLYSNHLDYQCCLRGEAVRPSTRLADAVPFVNLNALTYVSSRHIADFVPRRVRWTKAVDPDERRADVEGLDMAMEAFLSEERWLSSDLLCDSCSLRLGVPDPATLNQLPELGTVLHAIRAARTSDFAFDL